VPLAGAVFWGGTGLQAPASAQTVNDGMLRVTALTTPGLSLPTSMAFVADDDILVLQKNDGRVRRVLGGVLQSGNVLDVAVNAASERGLLGIAVRPGSTPTEVFLYYTEAASEDGAPLGNRVYRYTWNGVALVSPALILDLPVLSGPNHDGGVIFFSPEGLLHAVIGDLNREGQLQNFPNGPPPDDSGVILRVEPDGSAAAGNPFTPYCSATTTQTCNVTLDCPGSETCVTAVARYYAYGVRNSFGLTHDPVTGEVWDTENGPGSYDEVNHVPAGFNSGWLPIMGPDARDAQSPSDLWDVPGAASTYSDPEFSWQSTVAPTGIFFPFASTWGPGYDDKLLVGDNNTGRLYLFQLNGTRDGLVLTGDLADLVLDDGDDDSQILFGQGFGVVTDIEKGPDDHVYVVSLSAGTIYRISGPAVGPQFFRAEGGSPGPPSPGSHRAPAARRDTVGALLSRGH
jgi:glucose/arabinose dehydrogenase